MKSAIVTGASTGIGLAIAKTLLLELGYVVYGFARDFSKTEFTHDQFHQVACDITDTTTLAAKIKQLQQEDKHLCLLVNNAGVGYFAPHEELNIHKIHEMVATNLEAPLILTHLLLRTLKQNNGVIINISSVTAKKASPIGLAYSATKAGLSHFSLGLFDETRKYGVKVVTLHADMTDTPFYDNASFTTAEAPESFITPACIADAVSFVLTSRPETVVTEITVQPQVHRIQRKK